MPPIALIGIGMASGAVFIGLGMALIWGIAAALTSTEAEQDAQEKVSDNGAAPE